METLLNDVRYAIRLLRRNGGFTVAAVLTLALGIGANAAIFTVVNAVLLRPLPFGEPDRLVMIWMDNRAERIDRDVTSWPSFQDWQSRSRTIPEMAAWSGRRFNLVTGDADPEEILGARVTTDFFDVLGVSLFAGRPFDESEAVPGNDRVAILSHGLWQRRFAGAADIVGGTVRLSGEPYTVVGVAAPGFRHPETAELWVPLAPDSALASSRGQLWLSVMGRLAPGTPLAAAQTEMAGIADQMAAEYPANEGQGVRLEPLHETVVGAARPALLVLLGAVAFVLLIACANVANLLLARGAARRREIAVRLAVGAGGGRLARQLLTESLVLGLLGGLAGLGLAAFGVRILDVLTPPGIPRLENVRVDRTIVLFTFAIAVGTGLLFGLAPAAQAARASLSNVLRDEERGASGRLGRMRPILVAAQVALALVLLTGAGLMVRTFQALNDTEPGFQPDGLLAVRVTPPAARYPQGDALLSFYDRLTESIEALPGVASVGATSNLFLQRLPAMASIAVEGAPPRAPEDPVVAVVFDAATPSFFETFGLHLTAGRAPLATEDTRSPSVAVVNRTFVRQFLPDGDPLGRRFTFGNPDGDNVDWITVIGVIEDARRAGPTEPVRPEAFIPHRQFIARGMTILVKTDGDPLSLVPGVRQAVRALDPELPIADVATVERMMARAQVTRRFLLGMLLVFAGVAAILAAVGIYGVMAYLVSRRTREVGVRMAIGADRRDVVRLILRDAAVQILPGVAIGLFGAVLLARLMQSQLYGVSATDPLTLLGGAVALSGIGLAASMVPALRAARTSPLSALRSDG